MYKNLTLLVCALFLAGCGGSSSPADDSGSPPEQEVPNGDNSTDNGDGNGVDDDNGSDTDDPSDDDDGNGTDDSSDDDSGNGDTSTYTVNVNAGDGGSVSPESIDVEAGETVAFTLTADTHYEIASASGCEGSLEDDTYTTGTITEACNVDVSFEAAHLPAPENLTGEAGDGKIRFSWDEVDDATGYILAYGTEPGVDPANPGADWEEASANEYTLEGLDNGTTYYAVVTAVIEDVTESDASNEVSVLVEPPSELPGYEQVEQSADLEAGGYVVEPVQCPEGLQAFSGGVRLVGESGQTDTRIQRSNPGTVGGETSVWVTGVSNESDNDYEAVFYAMCAEPPEGFEIVSEELTVGAGAFDRKITACAESDHVVYGGGFRVDGFVMEPPEVQLQYTRPSPFSGVMSQWALGIANKSNNSRSVEALALCAPPTSGYEVAEDSHTLGPGSFERFVTWCDEEQVALSGGMLVSGPGTSEPFTEVQYEFRSEVGLAPNYGWAMGFLNNSAESYNLTSYAVCSDP